MPETTVEIAEQRAHQIRTKFRSMQFFEGKDAMLPALSIGVAVFPIHGGDLENILNSADQAVYLAKTVRNSVVVHGGKSSIREKRSSVP